MKASGQDNWTMVHAFYADSGGFVLETPDFVSFPITAKQLHYLVTHRYLPMPTITKEEIWDKSKADRFAKAVASFQAAWLVAQVIGRGIQRIPFTLLELSTVALITCTGAALFFWVRKPLNVETTTVLHLDISLAELLQRAGDKAKTPFQDTPLDFVEANIYTSRQMPLSKLWGVQERPLPRLPNDRDSRLHSPQILIAVAIPIANFSLVHFIGWNFDFPTPIEQSLWRWTCASMSLVLGVGCFVEAVSIVVDGYTTSGLTTLGGYKLKWPTNILFFVPGFLYVTARILVVIEVVVSLRLLPAGCFETIRWLEMLPHI